MKEVCKFKRDTPADKFFDRKTECLKDLLEYAYQLSFEEEPDYDKLRFLLVKMSLDRGHLPSYKFDWSYDHPDFVSRGAVSVLEKNKRRKSGKNKNNTSSQRNNDCALVSNNSQSAISDFDKPNNYHHLGPFGVRFNCRPSALEPRNNAIFYSNKSQKISDDDVDNMFVPDEVEECGSSSPKDLNILPSYRFAGYNMKPKTNYEKMQTATNTENNINLILQDAVPSLR